MNFVSTEKRKNGKTESLNAKVATKTINVNAALHAQTKARAARLGISLGEYTENALRHFAGGPRQEER